jgi:hypothetical protein
VRYRFTLTIAAQRLVAEMLGVDPGSIPEDYRARYNVAPTDPHFIVTSKYEQRHATGSALGPREFVGARCLARGGR